MPWGLEDKEGHREKLQKGKRKFGMLDLSVILIVIIVSYMYTNVKTYQMVYFKCVQFIIC